MQTPPRAAPHLTLGILTVLSALAVLLSANTAPPVAQTQLRTAAANTKAVSSFVLTDTNTVTPLTGSAGSRTEVVHIVYQAPDRVSETLTATNGQIVTLLVVGDSRYERSGTGKWVALGSNGAKLSAGELAAGDVLFPLATLASATSVVARGDRYSCVPADQSLLVLRLLGAQPAQLAPGSLSIVGTVRGEYLVEESLSAVGNGRRLSVDLAFDHIGSAPALVAPPASDLQPAAGH